MHRTHGCAALAVAALWIGPAARAEDPPKEAPKQEPKPAWTFSFKGWIGGSVYVQDGLLAPSGGLQGQVVAPGSATGTVAGSGDRSQRNLVLSGDVRSTRLTFGISGPPLTVLGAVPRGVAEFDLFGGNSSGPFGSESVFPRLRVATANLEWENTTLMVGQWHQSAVGVNTLGFFPLGLPEWIGHTSFPVTGEAGSLGWRYPGIYLFHRLPLGGDLKLELSANVARSSFANVANPGTVTVNTTTGVGSILFNNPDYDLGASSAIPQIEVRAILASAKVLAVGVSAHYSAFSPAGTAKATGTGTCATTSLQFCDTKPVYAADLSVALYKSPFNFKGHVWYGVNTSEMGENLLQFQNAVGLTKDDVPAWGGFAQLGFDLTKELSIWGVIGTEQLDFDKAFQALGASNAVRTGNTATSAMVRYREAGWAAGLEYTHWHTRYPYGGLDVNQFMISTFYYF